MRTIFIEEIIRAVNGVINKNIDTSQISIKGVSIDTRNINKGDLFIAIKGDNFDGHNFLNKAFDNGATVCISETNEQTNGILIKVLDTKKALKDLACYYLSLFDVKVIAITGSSGKTTTKDMIAHTLAIKYNVVKTIGNFNNEIGLPLTIFNIEDDTQIVVLEMGMNHLGEIRELSRISKPDVAIITNIGTAHIENLGSKDAIFRAKYEIFDYLKKDGIKILNGDDDILKTLDIKSEHKKAREKKKFFYSINYELDAFSINIDDDYIDRVYATLNFDSKSIDVCINYAGKHMVSNALAVVLVGNYLSLSKSEIKQGIESFKISKMRMSIIKTNKVTIIDDSYNANPSSMKCSIDVLKKASGRKVAILGDMLELGSFSEKFHYEIGAYCANCKIDVLIFIGKYKESMKNGALNNYAKKIYTYNKNTEFLQHMSDILKVQDTILVKASRGSKLENTVEEIKRW